MNISRYCSICAVLLLVQGISALSITVAPEQIEKGDQVTISIDDLSNNSTFSMQIEGTFSATPGQSFLFETRNLVLPFALNDGSLSATLRNTETNMLIVKKGDTEVKKVGLSQNGVFSTTDSGSIPMGTYDSISLGGTAAADATTIIASMTLQGTKSGPVDSEITFLVDGVTDGRVTITIVVDGGTALVRTILVGNPVTVTTTPTYNSGDGGGGWGGGSSVPAATTRTTATITSTTAQASPAATSPAVEETAAPIVAETESAVVATHEQTIPASPTPIRSPISPFVVPLGIAFVLFIYASKHR